MPEEKTNMIKETGVITEGALWPGNSVCGASEGVCIGRTRQERSIKEGVPNQSWRPF